MRQELNTLKGQMDDLQNVGGARALVERVNRHDAALRQVESSMALNLNLGDPLPSTPVSAAAPTTPAVPMTGTANTPSYGQPEATYGQPAQGGMPAGSPGYTAAVPAGTQPYQGQQAAQPAQAPNASTWGQPSPQPVVQAPQKDISLALFDAGRQCLQRPQVRGSPALLHGLSEKLQGPQPGPGSPVLPGGVLLPAQSVRGRGPGL